MASSLRLVTLPSPTGRYAPSRRPRRAALIAAAAGPADFSPEQLQAGLQAQLSSGSAAPAEVAGEAASRVPKKKASRREGRAAAAAAAADAEAAARQQSDETQRQLGQRALDDADVIAAALRTQLRQSGTFDEGEPEADGQLTPLAVVADDPLAQYSVAVAQLLLAASADVAALTAAEVEHCAQLSPAVGSLLLAAAQQASGGAAEGAETDGGAEEDPTPPDQMLDAIFEWDNARLSLLLAAASPEQLPAIESAHPYHAAALAGNDWAVCLLVAAGVPISAADAQCDGSVLGSWAAEDTTRQHLQGWSLTALGLGGADVVAALLAVGAAPDALSTDSTVEPSRQLTPLAIVVDEPHPQHGEAVAQSLLAGGASVVGLAELGSTVMQRCAEQHPAVTPLTVKAFRAWYAEIAAIKRGLFRDKIMEESTVGAMKLAATIMPPEWNDELVLELAAQLKKMTNQQEHLYHVWSGTLLAVTGQRFVRLHFFGKNVVLDLTNPVWSSATHHRFLPPFHKAVRTLLLAAHRGSAAGAGGGPRTDEEGAAAAAAEPSAAPAEPSYPASERGAAASPDEGAAIPAENPCAALAEDSGATQEGAAAEESSAAEQQQQQQPGSGTVGLASLPPHLLDRIIGLAAYPTADWLAMDLPSLWMPLVAAGVVDIERLDEGLQRLRIG
ncbi:hypothetical protein C2E21_7256 [Chlorella sorokiniana]|uniref:Uncharacterized protein n=1 Tax=Chlorella sorokiniana TaxID=3076 RepID=A0A2P6THT1_CHLSO|nr:hypothetical protein C2E21_7256 [Chlorella sorokiniana]|eukprot:PRW33854.1 hypothetical protein C2E21_7256 [Chlorella sorokiniana]